MLIEDVIREAEYMFQHDAEFHAIVIRSVDFSVPATINTSVNEALYEAARLSACIALVLARAA